MGKVRRIAIVGAGLGGLAAAIALRRQGFEVQVYERVRWPIRNRATGLHRTSKIP
jgi:salicylate hydroxylase